MTKKLNKSDLEDLLAELEDEVEEELAGEMSAQLTPEERRLADVAQRLLRLERDMLLPGNNRSMTDRVTQLGNFIEGEEF